MSENDSTTENRSIDDSNFRTETENMAGFRDALGFTVTEWRKDFCVLTVPLGKQHLNRNGFVHGVFSCHYWIPPVAFVAPGARCPVMFANVLRCR